MMKELQEAFGPIYEEFMQSPPIAALMEGRLTVEEYRSILRQIFHHTRENPQLQALATAYFRGRQRRSVRTFFKHAASEIDHDQLALNDFVALGGDATNVPYENPLPSTSALLAYGFYQIQNLNPIGYLGYLFFLEFTPTRGGAALMSKLNDIGVPTNALSFLKDHTEIDVGHNKLMEKYVEDLILSEADLAAVIYSIKTTAYLYENMLTQAMEYAHKDIDTGWNWEELKIDNPDLDKKADLAAAG
ncbi:MAG: iron-containing redox enzyme family protein [bacterium]